MLGIRNRTLIRCRRTIRLLLDLGTGNAVGRQKRDELLFTQCEAEGTEGNAEFVVIQVTVAIEIEESKLNRVSVMTQDMDDVERA